VWRAASASLASAAGALGAGGWLAVAALAAAGAGWWLRLWWRRRPRVRRRPRLPRHAVVLAHGLMGFDEIRLPGGAQDYFRGVRARLEAEGIAVHRGKVGKTASVAARAADLAAFVQALPHRRVSVVAHSMGGLDARFAVARLGLDRKVAAVVTIGTPHLGTPLADMGAGLAERVRLLDALARLGMDVAAFRDLTSARMAEFNRVVPDVAGVHYASVIGAASRRRDVNPFLLPTYLWLSERGPSDGVVPAHSQRWGELLRSVDADHWAQIGWSRHFDAGDLYVEIARELGARGL
jgi:triacylglycerol lipase